MKKENAALSRYLEESGVKKLRSILSIIAANDIELGRSDVVKLMSAVMSEDSKRISILKNFDFNTVSYIYSRARTFLADVCATVSVDKKNDLPIFVEWMDRITSAEDKMEISVVNSDSLIIRFGTFQEARVYRSIHYRLLNQISVSGGLIGAYLSKEDQESILDRIIEMTNGLPCIFSDSNKEPTFTLLFDKILDRFNFFASARNPKSGNDMRLAIPSGYTFKESSIYDGKENNLNSISRFGFLNLCGGSIINLSQKISEENGNKIAEAISQRMYIDRVGLSVICPLVEQDEEVISKFLNKVPFTQRLYYYERK